MCNEIPVTKSSQRMTVWNSKKRDNAKIWAKNIARYFLIGKNSYQQNFISFDRIKFEEKTHETQNDETRSYKRMHKLSQQ